MRKKLVILMTTLCLFLTGCGKETVINEYGNKVTKFGPYIEISREKAKDIYGNVRTFVTAYDEDTHIVYRVVMSGYLFEVTELYTYDKEGHPILQFYEDGKIVTK